MKSAKKKKVLKALETVGELLQKCGGRGGTPGPCPTGKKPPKGGSVSSGYDSKATEVKMGSIFHASQAKKGDDVIFGLGDSTSVGGKAPPPGVDKVRAIVKENPKVMAGGGWSVKTDLGVIKGIKRAWKPQNPR